MVALTSLGRAGIVLVATLAADIHSAAAFSVAPSLRPAAGMALRSGVNRPVRAPAVAPLKMGFFDSLKELAMPTEMAALPTDAPIVAPAGPLTWLAGNSEIKDPRHDMEDAWYVGDYDFGVFDGVSGSQKNAFGDLYSFQLCGGTFSLMARQRSKREPINPGKALDDAVKQLADIGSIVVGASTACVCTLDTSQAGYTYLNGVNIGDSGVTIVRRGADGALAVIYRTVPQMHYFNCPFQLGGSSPDSPDLSTKILCPLLAGDVVIVGTDGLYDNVYESQILDLMEATWDQDPNYQAQVLVSYARQSQEDPDLLVPYGIEAQEAKEPWRGGKMDDTAILVYQFFDAAAAAAAAEAPVEAV
mmetsp:Transcript_49202/g.117085  ORF Transcript_49202/g.117085 Transcript_49202/m.117085 type:complete len:359 (-) Transcript_49202:65-1141(-)|eukprot:CAMPEP_0180134678 /NCGR_PEP_ID=MMETSP0986-20121125/10313_1 /TAXON_ID=697907 /ORGANISM="non described non described, Strain CCMP2293" /LENGTH=358 /DNA_ID=CAMNT_0022075101 /DNA_START=21 /DNA_END=1097 /DNA_ORIENTATION=+